MEQIITLLRTETNLHVQCPTILLTSLLHGSEILNFWLEFDKDLNEQHSSKVEE